MTAFQQKNEKKVENISIEMQRNRFETDRGRLRFKANYRLCAVKGSIAVRGKSPSFSRCELVLTM